MKTYEELLQRAHDDGLFVIEQACFESASKGLIAGDVIGISRDLTSSAERACILAEEIGHYFTAGSDITDQRSLDSRKRERKARLWAYRLLVPPAALIDACEAGCRTRFAVANHLGVTEEFLADACAMYRSTFGTIKTGNHIISFHDGVSVTRIL